MLSTQYAQEVFEARKRAHKIFDQLWKTRYQRIMAYNWLSKNMGLDRDDCHIADFNLEQCEKVIRLVTELRPQIPDKKPLENRFERRKVE